MAELDNIPQKQTIEIETVKLDENLFNTILELQQKSNLYIADFGQIYVRKKEIEDEMLRLNELTERTEDEFKAANMQLKELVDSLDEKYPQGRINLKDGTVQYQPGVPTRKQLAEQQAKDAQSGGMKVVKE
jgi:hypothetical protein